MTDDSKIAAIKVTIEALINAGTTNDIRGLDQIYHDDMRIHMIDTDYNLIQHDKPGFIAMLEGMIDAKGGAPNTWAQFNEIEAKGSDGHVLITRKVKMGNADRVLVLSIDLIFEDDRWQVIREVIFSRPNPEPTPV